MSGLDFHYCAAEGCHVMIYNPEERYCQHHEGQVIFDAAYGTNTRPKDKKGENFFRRIMARFSK